MAAEAISSAASAAAARMLNVDPFEYTLPTKQRMQELWDAGDAGEDEFLSECAAAFSDLVGKSGSFAAGFSIGVPEVFRVDRVKYKRSPAPTHVKFYLDGDINDRDLNNMHHVKQQIFALMPADVEVRISPDTSRDIHAMYLDSVFMANSTSINHRARTLLAGKQWISHWFNGKFDEVGKNMDYRMGQFYENWGTWELFKPSGVLTLDDIANPPKESLLNDQVLMRQLILLRRIIRAYTGRPVFQLEITHGPDQEQRLETWTTNDEQRRRLAVHLKTLPGILVDMKHDPNCPWKGMKFFHGNNFKYLQSQTPEEIRANAQSSKNYNACQLNWTTEYTDVNGDIGVATAFTTPYHTKSFTYGKHVYTYRLTIDGKELCMLDLRNDYLPETHNNPELDPFKIIWELAGIPHGNSNRVEKARMLQKLFKDSGVHGAIINADVEWVWFDPSSVLEWIPPNPNDPIVEEVAEDGLSDEEAEMRDRFNESGMLMLTNEFDDDFDPTRYSFSRVLFNTLGLHRDVLMQRALEWIESQLDAVVDTNIAYQVVEALPQILSTISTTEVVPLSDLPIVRWKLDATVEGYMPQFVPTKDEHVKNLPRQWVAYQHRDSERKIVVHVCKSSVFWSHLCPELADVWMADPVVEGGEERHASLVYRLLAAKFKEMGVYVLFELPNGFHKLIPRVEHEEIDTRLYTPRKTKFPRPSDAHVKRVDLPFRSLFKRKLQITTQKRAKSEDDDSDTQEARPNPAFSASAAAAAPSKTAGRKIRYCI